MVEETQTRLHHQVFAPQKGLKNESKPVYKVLTELLFDSGWYLNQRSVSTLKCIDIDTGHTTGDLGSNNASLASTTLSLGGTTIDTDEKWCHVSGLVRAQAWPKFKPNVCHMLSNRVDSIPTQLQPNMD